MMYTIVLFNGTVKHYPESVGKNIAKAKHEQAGSVTTSSGELLDCKAIANILPFNQWRREEEQKLISKGKKMRICDFGQFHEAHENCDCKSIGLFPCSDLPELSTPFLPPVLVRKPDGTTTEV